MKFKLSLCAALCSIMFSLPGSANAAPASTTGCIEVLVTYLVCQHTYGNPPKTEESRFPIPNGSTVEDAKEIGKTQCVAAGAKIRERLDKEAGGKDRSRVKYPAINNVIGGILITKIKICIPFLKLSSVAEKSFSTSNQLEGDDEVGSIVEQLIDGTLDPATLTADQVDALEAQAVSEDEQVVSFEGIELPVASN